MGIFPSKTVISEMYH